MDEYTTFAHGIIGKTLKQIIEEQKIPIEDIARQTQMSKTIIYNIINGKDYQMSSFIKLCRVLKVHLELSELTAENNNFTMTGGKPNLN